MPRSLRKCGLARWMGLAFLLGVGAAGCSANRAIYPDGSQRTVVRRPIFNMSEEKSYNIGGYAGSSYQRSDIPAR